jgi:hypothetical protein
MFSQTELERQRGCPEIGLEELIRFFTLTAPDEAFIRGHRGWEPAGDRGPAACHGDGVPPLTGLMSRVTRAPGRSKRGTTRKGCPWVPTVAAGPAGAGEAPM